MAISAIRKPTTVISIFSYLNCLRFRTYFISSLIALNFVIVVSPSLPAEQPSIPRFDSRHTNKIYDEIGTTDRSFDSREAPQPCYDIYGKAHRCEPPFENAAFNRRIEATSTCGERSPTPFCIQTGQGDNISPEKTCLTCHANDHPPRYMVDFNDNYTRTTTYWQSETMNDGIDQREVNVTLHLEKAFDITYIRLKFESMRPHSLAIFKKFNDSEDTEWVPFQYYSYNCPEVFNVEVSSSAPNNDETKALCTGEYSEISPLSGGNVIFTSLEGRPSKDIFEHSAVLQDFITATKIRIVLKKLNTFGDDVFRDPIILKSYYYAISDFAVGGRCKCNGHANRCIKDGGRLRCDCQHHTAGIDCEKCDAFYNDQDWAVATPENANECKPINFVRFLACNCNGKSNKCFFDRELYTLTGHGGHCVDCRDNTDGPNCENCKPNYYQNANGICVPCNCNKDGSDNQQCDGQGKCTCRPGVVGQHCDRCAPNHYEFSPLGCKPCECNSSGSVGMGECNPYDGKCRCKANVEGQRCERCKPGYFDLSAENDFGCLPCFCYGHSTVCSSAMDYSKYSIGTTFTRESTRDSSDKWTARDTLGREVRTIFNPMTSSVEVRAEGAETIYFVAPERYLKDQRASYNQYLTFTLRIGEDNVRSTFEDVIIRGKDLSISQPIFGQGNRLPSTRPQLYRFKLHDDISYGWTPRLSSKDFIAILSNIVAIEIRGNYLPRGSGYLEDVRLESAQQSSSGPKASWIEHCDCPNGYTGQFCESCTAGWRREKPNGGSLSACIPCNCNGHADDCDSESGKCICQHFTEGDNCERCAVGYYGNAVNGSADDCQPCDCPDGGACVVLNDNNIACLQCPEGYTGFKCDQCNDGYFGDPESKFGSRRPCRKCECHGNVDPNAVGNCDYVTGDCLKCIFNTYGRHCEKCLPGFYGNATVLPKGNCKSCGCHSRGTKSSNIESHNRITGVAFLCDETSGQCDCRPNVFGRQCDQCLPSYWNIDSGEGCEPCNCNVDGSESLNCDIRTGQCKCKPGVTGEKCDKCLPLHYGFSAKGCQECHCDEVGSTALQCDERGQCPCQRYIEGRRCERCRENMYNMSAGCIDCPPCYNLVQDAVTIHRSKLGELTKIIEDIETNPGVIEDQTFETQLREVTRKVEELLQDARRAQGTDGALTNQLEQLKSRIDKVTEVSQQINARLKPIELAVNYGKMNITEAEDILERAKGALTNARRLLDNEGIYSLNKARERSKKYGQQSERMSEIARMATGLAERHEQEAETISGIITEALNTSRFANELAKSAIESQDTNRRQLELLSARLDEVGDMLRRTLKMAEEAKRIAKKAHEDAVAITTDLETFNSSLPKIEADKITQDALELIKQARSIANEADKTMEQYSELLNNTKAQLKDAKDLLEEARRQQQITDELFAEVDAALQTAKEAVEAGEATLSDAKKTLETLKAFDKLVQESRDKAKEAMKKVPEIRKLIEEAEEKTGEAENALQGALKDAQEALDVALNAQDIAEKASQDSKRIKEEAATTKDRASKLKQEASDLSSAVDETSERMKTFEEQAENDKNLAHDALERANQAKTSSQEAGRKVANATRTIDEILESLVSLDDIDMRQLDELERKLKQAEEEYLKANLQNRTDELKSEKEKQSEKMRNYDEEIARLTQDVANIKEISEAIPRECHKSPKLEP
ncbi:laminin subunit gamma-1-like protein [Leptotrombidium deliense]|uniref:Laminin subunit gamma-1-like protein n=1 Tax=Leptotrombidium deliense TaxID=299467 RepID=A0A443SN09_9ACAR|nr:laminin subunit gamma-1-like protein [Leptotrombidium deliense]